MVQSAPILIVLATVLVVNLRFVMYSAALAPFFRELPIGRRWIMSYALTDHLFALVNTRFSRDGTHRHVDAYFIGGAVPTWLMWNVMVAIGIFAGTLVPKEWSLDFAIPLVFLALVFPALQTRAHWVTAATAATAAYFTTPLPMKLGLIAAALTGVVVGSWLDYRDEARARGKA
jgi:predicted branched-subunit amino acid permease